MINFCDYYTSIQKNSIFKSINIVSNFHEKIVNKITTDEQRSLVEEKTASKKLLDLDKAVYGIIDEVTKKDRYSAFYFINSEQDKTFELTGRLGEMLTGGNTLKILLPKNASVKKVNSILTNIIENDIGFASIKIKGDNK